MKLPFFLVGIVFGNASAELVGHWKFDEGEGLFYADSSPNGNDVTAATSISAWSTDAPTTGFANTGSLDFDGIGQYVSTPFPGIAGSGARTVAFWVKTNSASNHGIVAWGDSTVNGAKWHVRLNDNAANGPVGAIRTETQGDFTIGTTVLNDGEWHHVVSVYPEGSGELGTVIHYVDGVAEAAGGNGASAQAVNTSVAIDPVTIGRRSQTGAFNFLQGMLDDVRIYDRGLSAAEVAALSGATPTTDGLVAYYAMDEGTGDDVDDTGSGDNDGTLIAIAPVAPTWSDDAPPSLEHSLLFANNNDLLYTDYEGVGGTASRSVSFWFKTTGVADNGIVAWGNSGGSGLKWHGRLNSGAADGPIGALRLEIQDGRIVATTPVNDGEWHHAAIVFEEDADPDISDVVFYLDGEIDPVNSFVSVPINTQNTGGSFAVTLGGRVQGSLVRGFDGNLADVRVYDHGLSQDEVLEIMTGGGSDLVITSVDYTPGDPGSATITWQSRPGVFYRVETNADLQSIWLEEVDSWLSEGSTTSYTIEGIPLGTQKLFFRVWKE